MAGRDDVSDAPVSVGAVDGSGADAGGVTWTWPSGHCNAGGDGVLAAGAEHGVVWPWIWPVTKCQWEDGTKHAGKAGRTVVDLADVHYCCGADNLRLAVAQRDDNRSGERRGADNDGVIVGLEIVVCFSVARHDQDVDGGALLCQPAVVQVVEITGAALVEDGRAAERQRPVVTAGEAGRVEGASLGRVVELELVARGDVSGAVLGISDDAVRELRYEDAVTRASVSLLHLMVMLAAACARWSSRAHLPGSGVRITARSRSTVPIDKSYLRSRLHLVQISQLHYRNLELAVNFRCAASRRGGGRSDFVGDALGEGKAHRRENGESRLDECRILHLQAVGSVIEAMDVFCLAVWWR